MACCDRIKHRADALKLWLRRSLQLKGDEAKLKSQLAPGVADVLRDKRLLLWKEMLTSINYSDMGVFGEFCAGSELIDQTPVTGLWPSKVTPATFTQQDLYNQARGVEWVTTKLSSSTRRSLMRCGTKPLQRYPKVNLRDRLIWQRFQNAIH